MTDEARRLDLIQRYAQRLGEAESNIAELMTPIGPETMPRPSPSQVSEMHSTVATPPPPRATPTMPRAQAPVGAKKAGDRGPRVQIDLDRLESLGCIVPDGSKKTQLVEQFQIIKRPLIQKALMAGRGAIRNGNSVMVTSAKPGEGKSFVALNLAMSIASERDLFVMLVDCDLYNHSLLTMLGIKIEKGLVDVLVDDALDVGDVLLRTNIPNLSILPSGQRHSHSTELLSSQRMSRVMRDVVSRYPNRIIIVDSPPVLASTEAGVLASHVGQIVMVVEQNRTGWRLVEQSLARLSECPDISFVLNKVEPLWDKDFGDSYR